MPKELFEKPPSKTEVVEVTIKFFCDDGEEKLFHDLIGILYRNGKCDGYQFSERKF